MKPNLKVKRRLDWDSTKETSSQSTVSTIKFAPKVIFKAPSLPTKLRPVVAGFMSPVTLTASPASGPTAATTPPPKPIVNKVTIQSPPLTEDSATPSKGKHRYETSLGQLTRKFISLLQNASDGVSLVSLYVCVFCLRVRCFKPMLFPNRYSI